VFNVYDVIAQHGLAEARRMAASKAERICVDAAAAVLAAGEPGEALHGGLAVICPPHRRLPDGQLEWTRRIGNLDYRFESGRYDDGAPIGIPFGAAARNILLYFHDEAFRHRSRVIEVVPSMNAWVRRMGLKAGGATYRLIAEQARRIATCRVTVARGAGSRVIEQEFALMDEIHFENSMQSAFARKVEAGVFPDRVVLSEAFYCRIVEETATMRHAALRQITDNCWAIDLYVWLSYQLPRLDAPLTVPWATLQAEFGGNYKHARQVKPIFCDALQLVLAIYPQAAVEILAEGLVLKPSRPPTGAS
jgi:hypothetical protein